MTDTNFFEVFDTMIDEVNNNRKAYTGSIIKADWSVKHQKKKVELNSQLNKIFKELCDFNVYVETCIDKHKFSLDVIDMDTSQGFVCALIDFKFLVDKIKSFSVHGEDKLTIEVLQGFQEEYRK